MSTFSTNHVASLLANTIPDAPLSTITAASQESTAKKARIYSLIASLSSPFDKAVVRASLAALGEDKQPSASTAVASKDNIEDAVLMQALAARVVVGLYAEAMDLCLKEASEADAEADWWSDIERSSHAVAWYLLQTLPERCARGIRAIFQALQSNNIPLRPSSFNRQSFHRIFPQGLRPSILTTAFFPHVSHQAHAFFTSPFERARQECRIRKERLEELRDERANQLGCLFAMRNTLAAHLQENHDLSTEVFRVCTLLDPKFATEFTQTTPGSLTVLAALRSLAFQQIPRHVSAHVTVFSALRRPSRVTRLWPRIVFMPPTLCIAFWAIYSSRQTLSETVAQAAETIAGFWFGYVVEPIRSILNTVRTGGDEGLRIINMEGVKADMESLERMSIQLSKDKFGYTPAQLDALSRQIRQGDLTAVLKIYEEDMKSPIRSAIRGSLIRSLLIQVQKVKVDIDQALSGIDKLLKSQELTFGFVGVAPSLAVVYVIFGYLRNAWVGGRGGSRYGGRRKREHVWLAMRRIERLLVNASHTSEPEGVIDVLSARTVGLLLISVAHVRGYAETNLPARSRLREGVLEDVADLESPDLGRLEKLRVVERMWRSWGTILGWQNVGDVQRVRSTPSQSDRIYGGVFIV